MATAYGSLKALLKSNRFYKNNQHTQDGQKFTTFTADIAGAVSRQQWQGRQIPKAVQGLELIAKGWISSHDEITLENIVSIKRIIYNHFEGYYSYLNESENLLSGNRFPISID